MALADKQKLLVEQRQISRSFVFSTVLVEMIKPFLLFKLTDTNQIFVLKIMYNFFNNKLYPFILY